MRTGGPAAGCAARRASCRLRSKAGQFSAAQQAGPAAGCAGSFRLRRKLPAAQEAAGCAARRASCQLRSKRASCAARRASCAARRANCRLRSEVGQLPAACAARRASCRLRSKAAVPRTLTRRPQGPLGTLVAYTRTFCHQDRTLEAKQKDSFSVVHTKIKSDLCHK